MPPKTRRPRESTKEWLARKLAEDREDEKLDWARAEKEDERDKRCVGAPCNGNHQVDRNGRIKNAHMVMYRCTRKDCGLRLLYIPSVGSHGNTRKATPLEHLRAAEEPENINAEGAEDRYRAPTAKAKPKGRPKAKPPPRARPPRSPTADEEEELEPEQPTWDGSPDTWEIYRVEMETWLANSTTEAETEATGEQESDAISWGTIYSPDGLTEEVSRRRQRSSQSSRMTSGAATPSAAPKRNARR